MALLLSEAKAASSLPSTTATSCSVPRYLLGTCNVPASLLLAAAGTQVATPSTEALRVVESVESGHTAHDVSAIVARAAGVTAPSLRMDSQVGACLYSVAEAPWPQQDAHGVRSLLFRPSTVQLDVAMRTCTCDCHARVGNG